MNMNKRHRGSNLSLQEPEFLKGGDRPVREDGEVLDFEDEYEDEYESEDEILEAGVDGRPDAEREAEEAGMCMFTHTTCVMTDTSMQKQWTLIQAHSFQAEQNSAQERPSNQISAYTKSCTASQVNGHVCL